MNTEEYKRNKERKQAQYKSCGLSDYLIEIEKDDLKSDSQGFRVRLISEINKKAAMMGVKDFVNS